MSPRYRVSRKRIPSPPAASTADEKPTASSSPLGVLLWRAARGAAPPVPSLPRAARGSAPPLPRSLECCSLADGAEWSDAAQALLPLLTPIATGGLGACPASGRLAWLLCHPARHYHDDPRGVYPPTAIVDVLGARFTAVEARESSVVALLFLSLPLPSSRFPPSLWLCLWLCLCLCLYL